MRAGNGVRALEIALVAGLLDDEDHMYRQGALLQVPLVLRLSDRYLNAVCDLL